jgi:hypothetical protein
MEICEPTLSEQPLGQGGATVPDSTPPVIFVVRVGSALLGTIELGDGSAASVQLLMPNVWGNIPLGDLIGGSERLNFLLDGWALAERFP